jgi:integrase
MRLTGKTGERETVYCDEETMRILLDRPSEDLLFPKKASSRTFNQITIRLGLNAPKHDPVHKVRFHTLRHTFASWVIQRGASIYSVQKLLRHKSPVMTQRYAHLRADDQRQTLALIRDLFPGPKTRAA